MAETKLNREMYDDEELENIACILHEPTSKLPKHGYFSKASGTSMSPTINDGDTVLWVEVENKVELKVGDIIIFKNPVGDNNIAHRIVSVIEVKGKYLFQTKGDKHVPDKEGRRYKDRYAVPDENVLGAVAGVIYKTRWGQTKNEETR